MAAGLVVVVDLVVAGWAAVEMAAAGLAAGAGLAAAGSAVAVGWVAAGVATAMGSAVEGACGTDAGQSHMLGRPRTQALTHDGGGGRGGGLCKHTNARKSMSIVATQHKARHPRASAAAMD